MLLKDLTKALDRNEKLKVSVLDVINYVHKSWSSVPSHSFSSCSRHVGIIKDAEPEEILSEGIIALLPLETLLQIANEKGCIVNEVNMFVNIDDDITILSQVAVRSFESEFLEEKQNGSSKDTNVGTMDQTPPNKTETIETLEFDST
ncbi:hypothetical protein HNY73_010130 [Argiope bruennichi]|uniref:Uncharacterized protein n=1 Tax=Argiope bruennichi TaxID=94029 RepID=A0A8T0F003_ARGBR|nr:hypothetical protein HNY73_010130 [Argiope bruennichi]